MKSRKLNVTAVAILATLTFTTTAFAGIFDVVGTVVGGVLGVQMQLTQDQVEKFNADYLDKVAAKIKQTGDAEAAFRDAVEEQRKYGYTVNVVQNSNGQIQSFDVSGKNIAVIVKSTIDRQQQLMTIRYENPDGTPVGNTLTKKYELPTTAVAAQQVDVQKPQDNPSPFASIPFVSSKAVLSPDMKIAFEQMPIHLKEKEIQYYMPKESIKEYIQGGKTGCTAFDNSKAIDKPLYVLYAYIEAKRPGQEKVNLENLVTKELKKINDPFSAPRLKAVANDLVTYYSVGHFPNIVHTQVSDYLTGDVNYIVSVYDGDGLKEDSYSLKKQIYTMRPSDTYFALEHSAYNLPIPVGQVERAYNMVKKVFEQNKSVVQNLTNNKSKNIAKQNLTLVRVCEGLNTICDYKDARFVYRDAHFSIKTLTFGVSVVNGKQVLDFKNSKWQDLLSATQSNCVVTSFN